MRKTNITSIVQSLFKEDTQETTNIFNSIINEQHDATNSPNFFFKGEVYIHQKGMKVNPVDDSLRDRLKGYLSIIKHTQTNYSRLNSLLVTAMVGYPPEYLYYLFPKQAHHILDSANIYQLVEEPSDLAQFLPSTLPEIDMLIKEQLLNSLI